MRAPATFGRKAAQRPCTQRQPQKHKPTGPEAAEVGRSACSPPAPGVRRRKETSISGWARSLTCLQAQVQRTGNAVDLWSVKPLRLGPLRLCTHELRPGQVDLGVLACLWHRCSRDAAVAKTSPSQCFGLSPDMPKQQGGSAALGSL